LLHPRLYAGHPLRGLGAISKGGYQVREADESVKPRALALGICRNKLGEPAKRAADTRASNWRLHSRTRVRTNSGTSV